MKILNFFAAVLCAVVVFSSFASAGMAHADIEILREQLSANALAAIIYGTTDVNNGVGLKPLVNYV